MLTYLLADCLIPDWPLPEGEARRAAVARAAVFVRTARALAPFYIRLPMQIGCLVLAGWILLLAPGVLRPVDRYHRAARAIEIFEKILPGCRALVRLYRSTAFLAYFGDEAVLPALGAESGTERQKAFRQKRASLMNGGGPDHARV